MAWGEAWQVGQTCCGESCFNCLLQQAETAEAPPVLESTAAAEMRAAANWKSSVSEIAERTLRSSSPSSGRPSSTLKRPYTSYSSTLSAASTLLRRSRRALGILERLRTQQHAHAHKRQLAR